MAEPKFTPVDMQALMEEGVLMMANEVFFWPLGLALAWTVDADAYMGDLHVREWVYEDGHHERIELAADDEVGIERRKRFVRWLAARTASMPADEPPTAATATAIALLAEPGGFAILNEALKTKGLCLAAYLTDHDHHLLERSVHSECPRCIAAIEEGAGR